MLRRTHRTVVCLREADELWVLPFIPAVRSHFRIARSSRISLMEAEIAPSPPSEQFPTATPWPWAQDCFPKAESAGSPTALSWLIRRTAANRLPFLRQQIPAGAMQPEVPSP